MSTGISIVWTTLPNGIDPATGHYRVSVLATPQITPTSAGATLASFPLFTDWPSVVRGLTWTMMFNAPNVTSTATAIDAIGTTGSSQWQHIFPPSGTTPVNAWGSSVSSASQLKIHSYDAAALSQAIHDAYHHAAVHHTSRPPVIDGLRSDPINDLVREARAGLQAVPHMARAMAASGSGSTHGALHAEYQRRTGGSGLGYEFARHALFYDRGSHRKMALQNAATPIDLDPPAAPQLPSTDFHQILGQLADHPQLLRQIGLVVDLTFTLPATGILDLSRVFVRAMPSAIAGVDSVGTPWTICSFTSTSFRALQRDPGSMIDGMLPMKTAQGTADPRFLVQPLDTDGAIEKLVTTTTGTTGTESTESPLPALRSAGLAVLRTDRESQVQAAINQQATLQQTFVKQLGAFNVLQFQAEDLVRGYRVDVRTNGAGGFKSLCRRSTTITAGGATLAQGFGDEGYVKGTAATSTQAGTIELHQSVFGWEGWSLVAPRPGRAVTSAVDSSTQVQHEGGVAMPNVAPSNLLQSPVSIQVAPVGLPQLRFGNAYEFRARLTDLAGNDMAIASDKAASPPVTYKRYEPVVAPTLVPQQAFTEGESLERLVIRSDPHGPKPMNASTYVPLLHDGSPAHPMNPYAPTSARWIAAPKTSWALAEAHKAFDGFYAAMATNYTQGGAAAQNAAFNAAKIALYNLSRKESGTFLDLHALDTSTNALVTTGVMVTTNAGPAVQPNINRGDALAQGQYAIIPASSPPILPYIPDANARGLALAFPSTTTLGIQQRTWAARSGCSWPELAVPQLMLQEGTSIAVAGVDGSAGLGSASPIAVSLPPGAQIDVTYSSTLGDPKVMALATSSAVVPDNGQNALLTPSRKLTFVHATQRPARPIMAVVAQPRAQGQTATPITGAITVEGLCADHLDLNAIWTEQVDAEIVPGVVEGSDGIRRAGHTGHVGTWALKPTDTSVSMVSPNATMHQFGDTKHREVFYQATLTSRFREYFPADLVADPANITSQSVIFHQSIPSSARPPMPKVLYVVPTYKWTTTTAANTPAAGQTQTTRTRTGGGLRVYVDRPWFCSGDGEMLGVLLHAPGDAATNLPDFVSQWGMDPIWYPQQETIAPLDTAHFVQDPNNPHVDLGTKQLAENGQLVEVLGYQPHFNKDREVWYFDIELSQDAVDSPFVRLALARVQPTSIGSLHLSPVVRADMVKLASDRTAVLTQNTDNSFDVTVTGRAFSNEAWSAPEMCDPTEVPNCHNGIHIAKYPGFNVNPIAASGHVVTVQIEQSTVANPGELDWTAVGGPIFLDDCQTGGYWDNWTTLISFKGHVPMPTTGLIAGAKRRLVIREWEVYESDDAVADGNGFVVHAAARESVKSRSRIAYTDILPLPY